MIDRQLLERFVIRQDSAAFRDLVIRHSPAVLRACSRYLRDPHEVEDALQATFLILLRRAPSIRDPETLGCWLVGVARRVALRSRRQGILRSERERRWAGMPAESQEQDAPLEEIRRVVREEMGKLPEVQRQSLALCYFEGLTHEQAAARLGWPVGTLKVRLVRARRQLRDRLDRRGVGLSVAFLLLLLRRDASASIAPEAVNSTVKAMTLAASGQIARLESEFPRAVGMARRVRCSGVRIRWGTATVIVFAILLVSSSGVALAHRVKSNRADAISASTRLSKVLTVDCR